MNSIVQSIENNPSFIARETLKRLAAKKIPPTPDNYFKFYNEIIGSSRKIPTIAGELLTELAKELPCYTPFLRNAANSLADAAKEKDWEKYKALIISLAVTASQADDLSNKPVRSKLSVLTECAPQQPEDALESTENIDYSNNYLSQQLLELIATMLSFIVASVPGNKMLSQKAESLAQQIQKINNKSEFEAFVLQFKQFCQEFERFAKGDAVLHQELFKFLHALMDSTQELLADDLWVSGQISKIKNIMSEPLNTRIIFQATEHLNEIAKRQKIIKCGLSKAKLTAKQLVNSLIYHIGELSNSTGIYHEKLQYFTERVNQVTDLDHLNQLLLEVLQETELIQNQVLAHQKELVIARDEANKAQEQISQLEIKLLELDKKVHEDHLTGVLNRRGFDTALKKELAQTSRNNQPLSLVLLDLDNFKLFNDTYGHGAGDDALVFLASIAKEAIRPNDIFARYGGEEFALLLPGTANKEASAIAARILRKLTKKLFLYRNNKLLITFSAGVAQYQSGESQESFLYRADKAMYQAKKNGKNQIISE